MTLNLMKTALLAGTAAAMALPYALTDKATAFDGLTTRAPHVASAPTTPPEHPAAAFSFQHMPETTPGFGKGFTAPRSFSEFAPVMAQNAGSPAAQGGFPPLGFDPTVDPSPSRPPAAASNPAPYPAPRTDAPRALSTPVYPTMQSSSQPGAWQPNPYAPAAPQPAARQPAAPRVAPAAPYYGAAPTAPAYPPAPATPIYGAAPQVAPAAPAYPPAPATPIYGAAPQVAPAAPAYPPAPGYGIPRPPAPAYGTQPRNPAYPPAPAYGNPAAPHYPPQPPAYGGYQPRQPARAYPHQAPAQPGTYPAPPAPGYGAQPYPPGYDNTYGQWPVQPRFNYAAPPSGWGSRWGPAPYPAYRTNPYGYRPYGTYPGYGSSYMAPPAAPPAARPAPAAPAYRQPAPAPRQPGRSGGNHWATGNDSLASATNTYVNGNVFARPEGPARHRIGSYAPIDGFDWERNLPSGAPAPVADLRPAAPASGTIAMANTNLPVTCSFHSGCVTVDQFNSYRVTGASPNRPAYRTQWSSAMFDSSSFYDGTNRR